MPLIGSVTISGLSIFSCLIMLLYWLYASSISLGVFALPVIKINLSNKIFDGVGSFKPAAFSSSTAVDKVL